MEFSARQVADIVKGDIEGNPDVKVTQLSKIEEGLSGSLAFLANPQYTHFLYTTDASIVIVAKNLVLEKKIKNTCTLIRVDDPRNCFALLLEKYKEVKNNKTGIEQPSFISKTAKLAENIYIGAFTYLGENVKVGKNVKLFPNTYVGDNSSIGDNTIVYAGVKIYSDSVIGKNCILHAGVVIGSDGFGFAPNTENSYQKIPHIGNVIIEDHVEIGSNTIVDRATLGSTIIRRGVKLDNLIQIAHNVELGENTVIAGLSGVAGSTKIGKNCMIGAQVGIVGHITIADGVKIAGQSGVGKSITKAGEIVQGSPAFVIGEYRRSYVMFRKLPEIQNQINELEKIVDELKQIAP